AAGLRQVSRQCAATMFMTLLAAFNVLLARYSGQDDIVVGTPIANRNRAETEGLIGFFVNTLVLRTDLSGDPTFTELVTRVRGEALAAYANQDLPFEHLVETLQPQRDRSRTPLFQVLFDYTPDNASAFALGDVDTSGVGVTAGVALFDLRLSLSDVDAGLGGTFEYSTALF